MHRALIVPEGSVAPQEHELKMADGILIPTLAIRYSNDRPLSSELCGRYDCIICMDTNKRIITEKERCVYIVGESLEMMCAQCDNLKERADLADMEYSNFLKACKMKRHITLDTYRRCVSAFDKDVVIFHSPKGVIDYLKIGYKKNRVYTTIAKEDIIPLLYALQMEQVEKMMLNSYWFSRYLEDQPESLGKILKHSKNPQLLHLMERK